MKDRVTILIIVGTLAIGAALTLVASDNSGVQPASPQSQPISVMPEAASPPFAPGATARETAATESAASEPDYTRRPTLPELNRVEGRTEFNTSLAPRSAKAAAVRSAPSLRTSRTATPGSLNPMARQQPPDSRGSSARAAQAAGVRARPVVARATPYRRPTPVPPVHARPVTVSR